MLSQVGL